MKEPALVAVIGVGGVLVGAIGSGAVQATVARLDRRRAGRDAARTLGMELHEAEYAIGDLRPRRDWEQMITDWNSFDVAWQQYRDQLTHILSTADFGAVDSAFACMRTLSRAAKRDLAQPPPPAGEPPHFGPPDAILLRYFEVVQRAKWIVLEASFRWWEKKAKRRIVAKRPPAVTAAQDLIFPNA